MLNAAQAHFYGAIALYSFAVLLNNLLSIKYSVSQVQSEWLCWCILLGLGRFFRPSKPQDDDHDDRPDRLAMAIAAICLFRMLGRVDWAVVSAFGFRGITAHLTP